MRQRERTYTAAGKPRPRAYAGSDRRRTRFDVAGISHVINFGARPTIMFTASDAPSVPARPVAISLASSLTAGPLRQIERHTGPRSPRT
jgi:hypothetical protein